MNAVISITHHLANFRLVVRNITKAVCFAMKAVGIIIKAVAFYICAVLIYI